MNRRSLVIFGIAATLIAVTQARAVECPYEVAHLRVGSTRNVYCKMNWDVDGGDALNASEWIVYLPELPSTGGQQATASRMQLDDGRAAAVVDELSPLGRPLMGIRASGAKYPRSIKLKAEYWANVNERHMEPNAGPPIAPLSAEEKARWLSESKTYDFKAPAFVDWLKENRLVKSSGESDVQFAWRAFDFIHGHYNYTWTTHMDRSASRTCTARAMDCGGSSCLFVSVLRANGIPARALVGRWIETGDDRQGHRSPTCHVKSEFFASGIGWVPVEMSAALGCPDGDVLRYFGQDDARFLTMHIDPDMVVDSIYFGQPVIHAMQSPAFWVAGAGKLDSHANVSWSAASKIETATKPKK